MTDPTASPPSPSPSPSPSDQTADRERYWRRNVRIMSALLSVWAVVGLGCGVLFADRLNAVKLGGFPLGFWFAQQGSIIVFVVLILIYAVVMNRLDDDYHENSNAKTKSSSTRSPDATGTGDREGERA